MARRKPIRFRSVLTRLLPDSMIESVARETGAVQRNRKVSIVTFFWTLVLGFGTGRERTISGLRRSFERATELTVANSTFHARFSAGLVALLRQLVAHAVTRTAEPVGKLGQALSSFADVVATDSTVIRLHHLLERTFPACRTNHTKAAVKLHAVMSINAVGPRKVRITSERVHDGPVLKVGRWVADRLLLFDLAYFRYQLFSCIRRNGGFFIARLKQSANPTITAVHRGSGKGLIGEKVLDVVPFLKRDIVDVEVEATFAGRVYGGKRRRRTERFRVVGVRNAETSQYHLYITNVAPERLEADDIARAYAARWVIELFFREFKRQYRVDDMPSAKREVVEALLYASILTLIASRALLMEVRRRMRASDREVPDERWAVIFADIATDLLVVVSRRTQLADLLARQATHIILAEARDPNRRRILLRSRAGAAPM